MTTASQSCLVRTLSQSVATAHDAAALCDLDRRLKFDEVWSRSGDLAETLASGLESSSNQVLAVLVGSDLSSVLLTIASLRCSAHICLIDVGQKFEDQARQVTSSGASAIVGRRHQVEAFQRRLALNIKAVVQMSEGLSVGYVAAPNLNPSAPRRIVFFTSGTTGPAKGVVHTDESLLWALHATIALQAELIGNRIPEPRSSTELVEAVASQADGGSDLGLVFLPGMSGATIAGFSMQMRALVTGAELAVSGRLDADQLLDLIQERRVTNVGVSPLMAQLMLRQQRRRARDLSSLAFFGIGAGPASGTLIQDLDSLLRCPVSKGYGMTETGGVIAIARPTASLDERRDTVGTPVPGVEVRIVDRQGCRLPVGQEGELAVKTRALMVGYLGGEASDDPWPQLRAGSVQWFRTGDRAIVRRDGCLELRGRLGELIIRGGRNIDPTSIERALESHLSISRACAFGMPGRIAGEEDVCALVVPRGTVDIRELRRYCLDTLGVERTPQHITLTANLPETSDGTVRRAEARALFEELRSTERTDC